MTGISIRPTHIYDASLYYRCRFDDEAMKMSGNTSLSSIDNHIDWLRRKLDNPARARYYTIVTPDGVGMGYVRFDNHRNNEWEVSVAVMPDYAGNGVAIAALEMAIREMSMNIIDPFFTFFTRHPMCDAIGRKNPPTKFIAKIHPDNTYSIKLFEKVGFEKDGTDNGFDVYKYFTHKEAR